MSGFLVHVAPLDLREKRLSIWSAEFSNTHGGLTIDDLRRPKTYIRDDGVVMVEPSPNLYVEESIAERLGLLR